jgi:hypothetical protein
MLIVIAFSIKCFGLVDMTEVAGDNVGRKEDVLSTIIATKHGTSFHGYSVIYYTVLYSLLDHHHSRCVMEGDL